MRDVKAKTYRSDAIAVTFEPRRCIHAAECVMRLQVVFDPERKPWIDPTAASADAIARVVQTCPTGALHFERLDGGAAEVADAVNTIRVARNGPLHVRGTIELRGEDGAWVERDVRVSLCRCGRTRNAPFCDNSHRELPFVDRGEVFEGGVHEGDAAVAAVDPTLRIVPEANGPYDVQGPLEVVSADGKVRLAGARTRLCRCGASRNRPFCDGSHLGLEVTPPSG